MISRGSGNFLFLCGFDINLYSIYIVFYVVFIDAYDVVMLGNTQELLERYYKFKKPVVLSVETKNSWFKWHVEKFYFGTYKEEIINSSGSNSPIQ